MGQIMKRNHTGDVSSDGNIRDNSSVGYDLLGNIAVIDTRRRADIKSRADRISIARGIMARNRNIETVVEKAGPVSGRYRTREFKHLLGKRSFIATYRENGAVFTFDIRRVFFSSRLSYERGRLASLIKDGESVAVPFAGVGPFPIVIAKRLKRSSILAIELNRYAYRYMLENIRANRVDNVEAVCGDFKRLSSRYKGFADRVIMQMPTASLDFIEDMLKVSKDRARASIYVFCDADSGIDEAKARIRAHLKSRGYNMRCLFYRVVRTYSKTEIEVVIDISYWRA